MQIMRKIFTNKRCQKFYKWKHSKQGLILWLGARFGLLILSCLLYTWVFPSPHVLYYVFQTIYFACWIPEWFVIIRTTSRYLTKMAKFGLFKPGHMLEMDPSRVEAAHLMKTTLVPVELAKVYDQPLPKINLKNPNFESMMDDWFDVRKKIKEVDSGLMMVIETEYRPAKPWKTRFRPSKRDSPKVKVLYEGKIYWANPLELRRVTS